MNLGELRLRAQERFRDVGGLIVSEPVWDEHINAAYRHFIRAARWPFLVTSELIAVPANQRLITPTTAALGNLQHLYDQTNGRVIHIMPPLPWRFRIHIEAQRPGKPAMYQAVGNQLYLLPPPKDAVDIQVYFFQDPAVLDDDADVPEIPERYHEALVVGAISKAHMDDQNMEAAERYAAELDAIVEQAIEELLPGSLTDPDGFVQGAQDPVDETR